MKFLTSIRSILTKTIARYGTAAITVACGLYIESVFSSFFEPVLFTFFIHVVFLTAWFCGFGPALFSTFLIVIGVHSLFSSNFFIPPQGEFALRMFSFASTAILM